LAENAEKAEASLSFSSRWILNEFYEMTLLVIKFYGYLAGALTWAKF